MRGMRDEIERLMVEVAGLDLGEPLPPLDPLFLQVWAEHYARIVRLSAPQEGSLTLEVGAGYGIIPILLSRRGERVVATEHPSRGYLFKEDYRRLLEANGVLLVANELSEGLPFGSGSFSKVLYCDVIEHLPPSWVETQIRELGRVLAPNGVLVVSTPNLARLWNRLCFLSGRPVNPSIQVRKVGETFDHIREYLWEELAPIFENAGFMVEGLEYGWIPHFNGKSPTSPINRVNRLLLRGFPSFGDEFYVRMVKR